MKILPVFVGALAVGFCVLPVLAQGDEGGPALSPPMSGRPVVMDFDVATLKDYLSRIDEPRNALVLQLGLFMGPRPSLTPEQSIPIIQEQIAKETVGSRRWAMLENLVGFGGFRSPGLNTEANEAYKALFSARLAADAVPTVEASLQAYLSSVGATGLGRGDSSSTPVVMVAALNAFLSLPVKVSTPVPANANPVGRPVTRTYNWADAVRNTGSGEALAREIEVKLKDPALVGASRLKALRVGAEINESLDAGRAVEMIQLAAPLATQFAPDDAAFTNLQVRILSANGKLPEAIAVRKAAVTRSGQGRASLLSLQARSKDIAGLKSTVEELKGANADSEEVLAAIAALQKVKDVAGVDANGMGREIAESYLKSGQIQTPEAENSVKLSLANLLYRSGDKEGAIKLLQSVPVPVEGADMMAQGNYRGIANALKRMQEGKY